MGSIAGLLAVATGAFGGHLLKERLSEDLLAIFEVGVRWADENRGFEDVFSPC